MTVFPSTMLRLPRVFIPRALVLAALVAVLALGQIALSDAAFAASGQFRGLTGHSVKGNVSISGRTVKLSRFRTDRGPALYVLASVNGKSVTLGKLKSTRGTQSYRLPAGVKAGQVDAITIYCRPFSVAFGRARIR